LGPSIRRPESFVDQDVHRAVHPVGPRASLPRGQALCHAWIRRCRAAILTGPQLAWVPAGGTPEPEDRSQMLAYAATLTLPGSWMAAPAGWLPSVSAASPPSSRLQALSGRLRPLPRLLTALPRLRPLPRLLTALP